MQATTENTPPPKKNLKIIIAIVLGLITITTAAAVFFFVWRNVNYLTTDNARVTTNLVPIAPNIPGTLERFTVRAGDRVSQNEIIGWVEHDEAMRSPVDGLVVYAGAVQGQAVSPMEPVAVIADTARLHIEANIEETDILRVAVGMPVTVTIDGLGNAQFNGYIAEIGHITQAELAGQALFFNTGGVFTRITHLIPVKINILDDLDLSGLVGVNARVRFMLNAAPVSAARAAPLAPISVQGVVETAATREINSLLGLIVEAVYVEVGDYVQAGQVLARLDAEDLALSIAAQRAALSLARQGGGTALADSLRRYAQTQANLAGGRNPHVLAAQAALSSSSANLEAAEQALADAYRDSTDGTNPQIAAAETALRAAEVDLAARERTYENFRELHEGGVLSNEEMRQAEEVLTHARNIRAQARSVYENAVEAEERRLNQLRLARDTAAMAERSAREILTAAQIAAGQEADEIRAQVTAAEIAADVEYMEIVLAQLERRLAETTITAPISGTVTGKSVREGSLVQSQSMFTIEDMAGLRIRTRFREYDLNLLEQGGAVTVVSAGREYAGIIEKIYPAPIPSALVPEFEVLVRVPDEHNLRLGMRVRVEV